MHCICRKGDNPMKSSDIDSSEREKIIKKSE